MNYDSNFLTNYSTSYGSSKLFSDDLVGGSSFQTYYSSSVPYSNSNRLFSDELVTNPLGLTAVGYRSSRYSPVNNESLFLSTLSTNNVQEQIEPLPTFSNTNYGTHQTLFEEEYQPRARITPVNQHQPVLTDRTEAPLDKYRSPLPSPPAPPVPTKTQKKPVSSPKVQTTRKIEKSTVETHTWMTEKQEQSKIDEKPVQSLPTIKKPTTHEKIVKGKDDKAYQIAFHMRHDSYFDSLFQGNFVAKPSTHVSYEQSFAVRNPAAPKRIQKPKITIKPPAATRPAPPPIVTQVPIKKQNSTESNGSGPANSDATPRAKNPDDRYREALQKFRADRAEQQQRELNESTAKRMNYGNYIRHSSKDDLLHNAIKPLPWSDFMYYKKGNVYSLTKEEKRDLHHLSKLYGERIRQRNVVLNQSGQTARTDFSSLHFPSVQRKPPSTEGQENKNHDSTSSSSTRHANHPEQNSQTTVENNRSNTRQSSGNIDIDISESEIHQRDDSSSSSTSDSASRIITPINNRSRSTSSGNDRSSQTLNKY